MTNTHIAISSAAAGTLFILGLFRNSKLYTGVRDTLGTVTYNFFKSVSRLGNSKLSGIYEPIEAIYVDFFLFMAEQAAAGLRSDNPEKLRVYAERLDGVGSETRKAAVEAKLAEIVTPQ